MLSSVNKMKHKNRIYIGRDTYKYVYYDKETRSPYISMMGPSLKQKIVTDLMGIVALLVFMFSVPLFFSPLTCIEIYLTAEVKVFFFLFMLVIFIVFLGFFVTVPNPKEETIGFCEEETFVNAFSHHAFFSSILRGKVNRISYIKIYLFYLFGILFFIGFLRSIYLDFYIYDGLLTFKNFLAFCGANITIPFYLYTIFKYRPLEWLKVILLYKEGGIDFEGIEKELHQKVDEYKNYHGKLLSIGSFVKIKGTDKKILIIGRGVRQPSLKQDNQYVGYDYWGIDSEEGFVSEERFIYFNREEITHVLFDGDTYVDKIEDEDERTFLKMAKEDYEYLSEYSVIDMPREESRIPKDELSISVAKKGLPIGSIIKVNKIKNEEGQMRKFESQPTTLLVVGKDFKSRKQRKRPQYDYATVEGTQGQLYGSMMLCINQEDIIEVTQEGYQED